MEYWYENCKIDRTNKKIRYRKVLYCMRRTLIFESRLGEMENEVLKSTVPEANYAHVGEDASRNGNVTLKALDAY